MKNAAISIRARLLNHSRLSGLPFNDVLEQYAMVRFLWRLSQSRDRSRFILKGAQLFRLWIRFGDASFPVQLPQKR
jgi:hypothetical protein